MKKLDEYSQRTNVLKRITRGFWILATLLALATIWLFVRLIDGSLLSGFFALLTLVAAFVSGGIGLFFTLVTNGSKRFDGKSFKRKVITKKNVIDL